MLSQLPTAFGSKSESQMSLATALVAFTSNALVTSF
jgi:hypothetical protein